jgi:hypothetical protein
MPPIRSVPTYFISRAEPPPLVLLLAQTDLGRENYRLLSINEEIPHHAAVSQRNRNRSIVHDRYSGSLLKSERSGQNVTSQDKPAPSPQTTADLTNQGSSLSEEEDDNGSDNQSYKFPKPAGEAGRPGRGGYNLQEKLDWPLVKFENFRVRWFTGADLVDTNLKGRITFTSLPLNTLISPSLIHTSMMML